MGHHPSSEREEDDQGQEGRAGDPIPFPKFHWTVQFPLPNPLLFLFSRFPTIYISAIPFPVFHSSLERSKEDKSKSNPTFPQAIKVPNLSLSFFLRLSEWKSFPTFSSFCMFKCNSLPLFTNFSSVASFNSFPPHHPPHKQKLNTIPCLPFSALFLHYFSDYWRSLQYHLDNFLYASVQPTKSHLLKSLF